MYSQNLIHKDLEDRKLLQATSIKLEKIINEKMSNRRIQIIELQKLENPQKEDKILLIRLHIFLVNSPKKFLDQI